MTVTASIGNGSGSAVHQIPAIVWISDSRRTVLGINDPVVIRTVSKNGRLTIGEDVGISGGSIRAAHRVGIG